MHPGRVQYMTGITYRPMAATHNMSKLASGSVHWGNPVTVISQNLIGQKILITTAVYFIASMARVKLTLPSQRIGRPIALTVTSTRYRGHKFENAILI